MNSYGMAEAVAAVCAAPVTSSNTIYIPKNMHPNQPVTFLSQDDPLGRSCCSVGGFSTNISDDFAASRFLVVDYETLEVVPEGVVGELWFTSEWLGQVCCVCAWWNFFLFCFFLSSLFRGTLDGNLSKIMLNLGLLQSGKVL